MTKVILLRIHCIEIVAQIMLSLPVQTSNLRFELRCQFDKYRCFVLLRLKENVLFEAPSITGVRTMHLIPGHDYGVALTTVLLCLVRNIVFCMSKLRRVVVATLRGTE